VVVAHAAAVGEEKIAGLGGVHRAAAAEGDEAVEFQAAGKIGARGGVGLAGILVRVVVDADGDAGFAEEPLSGGGVAGLHEAGVGDEEDG